MKINLTRLIGVNVSDKKTEREAQANRDKFNLEQQQLREQQAMLEGAVNKHLNGATCQHQHGATENATN